MEETINRFGDNIPDYTSLNQNELKDIFKGVLHACDVNGYNNLIGSFAESNCDDCREVEKLEDAIDNFSIKNEDLQSENNMLTYDQYELGEKKEELEEMKKRINKATKNILKELGSL